MMMEIIFFKEKRNSRELKLYPQLSAVSTRHKQSPQDVWHNIKPGAMLLQSQNNARCIMHKNLIVKFMYKGEICVYYSICIP